MAFSSRVFRIFHNEFLERKAMIFICLKDAFIAMSKIIAMSVCEDNKVYFHVSGIGGGLLATPYTEEELRQAVGDGKLNPRDLGSFGGAFNPDTSTDITEKNADFCFFVFLVGDSQGNVKLCNAQSFMGTASLVCGSDNNAACALCNIGVNNSAIVGNLTLCVGDPDKDVG